MAPQIPIYRPAKPWAAPRNRYVRLYHGCTKADADHIIQNGINLQLCRVDSDFGRGFYTTAVLYQARQWAWTRFYAAQQKRRNRPVVLMFVVDRLDLAYLASIQFVLGGRSRDDFWSLVQHCRQSTPKAIQDHNGPVHMHDGTHWYDLTCGPVSAFWRQRYCMTGADQFGFHTPAGVRLLQSLIDSRRTAGSSFKVMNVAGV